MEVSCVENAPSRLQSAQRMPSERPPKVFISYSHDSPEHEERVLAFADRLAGDGIDVVLDQYVSPPPANWPHWMEDQMESSDFIVVVCSEIYLAKVKGKVNKGEGKGVKWESLLSYQQIYDNDSDSSKFIPVLIENGKYDDIPSAMRGGNHYRLIDDKEYEKLLRHITNQPETPKLKLGPAKKLPPRPRPGTKAPASSKPWNVPHTRNDVFTGREQILSDLHADLMKKGKQALSGLGGVGKTQIAVEYAYRHNDEYTAVLWIFADTEQSVRGGFGQIAALLNLPEKDATEQAKVTEAVRRWLEENPSWLLVLDNADNPAAVKDFLPQQSKGHVLLTSRAHSFQTIGILNPREVDVLSPDEAREFLLMRTGKKPTATSPEVDALAKELGYLPLALEQAAAYMVENGASFASYLAGFKKQRQTLLNKQGPVLGNEAREQQKRTVATTWAVNFADIEKNCPASADLLRLSAFLAPDAIPLELLEKGAKEMPEKLAAKVAEAVDNPLMLDELLSPLLRYSLVRRNEEMRSYSIHPMMQDVLRDGLTKEEQKAWAERAVRIVNAGFPYVEFSNWPQCDRLLPHALACAGFISWLTLELKEAARMLNQAGCYLHDRAEYAQAEPLFERALAIDEKAFGVHHPDTATDLNNLAILLKTQGKHKDAEPLHRRALAIREKALGPEHTDTAQSLNNLAELYRDQGRYQEAEPLYQRALAIREKALGPEHTDTAQSLNNLALLLESQGKYKDAELLYRRGLSIFEKVLGPEHPDSATSMNNLGGLLADQGKPAEAEPLYRRALAIRKKVLGPEHPITAGSLNNLAVLLANQGKYTEADPLHRRALMIFEKVLGPQHPDTVLIRNNLILSYRKQGRNAEADALEKGGKGKAK
jgi:tetratricopeptide (TPR) repeat protein